MKTTIRITDNHGSYYEVFTDGDLVAHSEEIGMPDADSETLVADLAEEFGADAIINDCR